MIYINFFRRHMILEYNFRVIKLYNNFKVRNVSRKTLTITANTIQVTHLLIHLLVNGNLINVKHFYKI